MKMTKKIISGLLSVTLALGAVTFIPEQLSVNENTGIVASAAEFYKKVNGFVLSKDGYGDIFVSSYEGKGGNITIPSEATYVGESAFAYNTSITGVTFPDGTTKCGIGNNAFEGCTFLTNVTIKGDVGSGGIDGICADAFARCHLLKTVTFTKSDAHVSFIGEAAFMHCYSLSKINIPADTVKICNNAFTNCLKLSSITLPKKVQIEGEFAFGYMYGSETIDDMDEIFNGGTVNKYAANVKADGRKTVYWELCAANVDEASTLGNRVFNSYNNVSCLVDKNGEAIPYTFCTPIKQCTITLNVEKGYPAEKWAKSHGIKYKCADEKTASSAVQLDAPENLEALTSSSSVTLVWDDVEDASAYRVYIYDSKTNKYKKYKDVSSSKCKVTKLKSGTKYKFKVVALKKSGSSYKEGEYATISVTTDK